MAKRRKEKDEQEDKPFKIPAFDEEKFLKRERRNIKSTYFAALFGILMAIVCFVFWVLMGSGNILRWPLVFIVMMVDAIILRKVYDYFKIDYSDFTRKNWFTSYAIYFFTWLIIFIVIVNPPFYDDENPMVSAQALPEMQEFNGTVDIVARITDNSGVEKSGITLYVDDVEISSDNYTFEDNILKYSYISPDNGSEDKTYNYKIIASDSGERKTTAEGSFTYSNDAIILASHDATTPPGPKINSGTPITFDVKPDVDRVYYTVNDGKEINATLQGDYYVTYPKYQGWPMNKNVTVKVYAEVVHYFETPTTIPEQSWHLIVVPDYNNTINDSTEYYFQVGQDGIGVEVVPEIDMPSPRFVGIPGFETIALLASLVIIILIFKYRKKR